MTSLPSRGWGKSTVVNEMHETKETSYDQTLEIKKNPNKTKKPHQNQNCFCASFKLLVFPVNKIKKFPCKRKLYNSVNLGKFVKARTTDYLLT